MSLPEVVLPFACQPNVEYLSWMAHSPKVWIETRETFPKQTCRNRYAIMTATGPAVLTIPVKRPAGNNTPLSEVILDAPEKWVNLHWRAIESAYNKSPFFLYYRDYFEQIYHNPPEKLIDLNRQFLDVILKYSGIIKSYSFTNEYHKEYPTEIVDMRQHIMPKKATSQAFTIQQYKPYIQVFNETQPFAPNLSALDLLFNLGPETGSYLKNHCPGFSHDF